MDDKTKIALEKIILLTQQDTEFDIELRKRLGKDSSTIPRFADSDKIEQIYELCVEKILRQQAENFYKSFVDFPEKNLLIEDYVNMEHAYRRNKFDYYALCLYEQIERILNVIFEDDDFFNAINNVWDSTGSININTKEDITFGNIIWGEDKSEDEKYLTSGKERAKDKTRLSTRDKIRIVIYFFKYYAVKNYKAENFYRNGYNELCDNYLKIYLCRNTIHRGANQSEKDKEKIKEIQNKYAKSYFDFNYLLTQFVWLTKDYKESIKIIIGKLFRIETATIINIYPSAVLVEIHGSSETKQISGVIFYKIKKLKKKRNDIIQFQMIGEDIKDIIDE